VWREKTASTQSGGEHKLLPNGALAHLKIESLVRDHKYRGAPKDGHCVKE